MKNRKKLITTILITGISFVLGYFINFFLTRYVTSTIGTDAYGYVTLCKTIASYTVIATTALNSYSSRFITLEYHAGEKERATVYFNSVFWGNVLLGSIVLFCALLCTFFLQYFVSISTVLLDDVKVLFVFVFINTFISLISTAFQSSAYIKDKLYIVSILKGISYIIEAITLLVLFSFFPAKVYYVGVGIIIATLLNTSGFFIIYKKYTPDIKISINSFNLHAIKELLLAGIWNSFNALGNTLNNGLDIVVSNALLGPVAMGQVSIIKSISNIFSSLYQMVSQPFQPAFLELYAKGDLDNLNSELKFSMKISGLISNLAFAGVVAFGFRYYSLWLPSENTQLLYHLTIIAVATSIFEGPVYPLYYIYTLTIKNKIPCIVTIIGGIMNVIGMYILITKFNLGIYSIFITTAVIMNFINAVTNPIYMCKCLHISCFTFYPVLLRHIVSCIIVTFIMIAVSILIKPQTWVMLIFSGVVACCIGAVTHLLVVLNIEEWNDLRSIILRLRK